ncbi:serine acetyltransferase [Enterobacteriaceae bacterium H16N7]|nr:serine acetyltransferase [Dryocola clanedunensis]
MDKDFLKECLRVEVIGGRDKQFSWGRAIRHAFRQPHRRFLFWWRIASYLYMTGGKRSKKISTLINNKISLKYNTEVGLKAKISPGLKIAHYNAVVISDHCVIGKNLSIRQNTTIGTKTQGKPESEYNIKIGDNVYIGANCCIIADQVSIGNDVRIGAMSFVNKDIPDNSVFYQKKIGVIEPK